jgi:hypothetical protein
LGEKRKKDSSKESPQKQKKQKTGGKKQPYLGTSSLDDSLREIASGMCSAKQLGKFHMVYNTEQFPEMTHVVVGEKKRTLKILHVIANGKL